ncbi:hypothetical protein Xen7305DRAFT_00002340 [Xenococcus sp. PCC 7305]|uniref:HepT-like ribonuclease domain-containing protein n=1 Tax=Xenococcus sp. PCC 7305 TaxID=102125 RepID=UPI0002ABB6D7|nr:DUF86 domain-containing protein [Xenococcus sp. PCC 7305]ELS00533.1 hypothetical protein Xen7305DRAFT_00002340 [Xenococcus sp. PCC 7305]
MQRDLQFLLDMLQSAELIIQYTNQCSKDEFIENIQLQDSVIRRLLVIAEAARRVSATTRTTLSNISWQEINGMRNRLVHEYDDINLNIVWDVVQNEIPILIQQLKLIVPSDK